MRTSRLARLVVLGAAIGVTSTCANLRLGGGVASLSAQEATFTSGGEAVRLTRVADGLEYPWGLAFLPDGRMIVTEQGGNVRIVEGDRVSEPLAGVPEVTEIGQGGMLDVALHPRFAENRLVYLTFSGPKDDGYATHLWRGRLTDAGFDGGEIIFSGAAGTGGRHFGSRMVFDRDGFLFVSLGERGEQERAQDLSDLVGKIVRLNDDGSVPEDNPFVGRDGAEPAIWAYGVRNPQGMALHPETGQLWEQEHAAQGGDEVNRIREGSNYGWPLVSWGVDYGGGRIGDGSRQKPGITDPAWNWNPSIAPSGMAFYDGEALPGWRGDLLVGALKFEYLARLEMEGDRIVREERLLEGEIGRIRDIRVGPDGLVYLLNDESDGAVWRLEPAGG